MSKSLFVKCPGCGNKINLGKKGIEAWESPGSFLLEIECKHCGQQFREHDTSEGDYNIVECDKCAPIPDECQTPEKCGFVGGNQD